MKTPQSRLAVFILQLSLAFVFLWFGVDKLLTPESWTIWIPQWMNFIPLEKVAIIYMSAVIELILGVWVLLPIHNKIAAIIMVLYFIPVLSATGLTLTGIRDASLAIAAISLAMQLKSKRKPKISYE